jgi:SMODS-associated and fused to various effectors sensor domain/CHAT domain
MTTAPPIILRHSMFPPKITDKAVLEALPAVDPRSLDWVDIHPDYQELDHYDHGYDWASAAREQKRQFKDRLEPLLNENPLRPVIYFGLAPIPLAFQLGTLVTHRYRFQIHQHHHVRSDWRWLADAPRRPGSLAAPTGDLGEDGGATGDLVLRVSTAHAIAASDTRVALEGRTRTIRDFDFRVGEPSLDCFESRDDLEDFCGAFGRLVDDLSRRYSAAQTLHLFAAVPCGVAFRMGTYYSNTKKLKPVETYQYDQHCMPRYARALAIGHLKQASLLLLTADPSGWTPTSGLSEVKMIRELFEPHGSRIKVTLEPGLVASDLQRLLDRHARILHFAGHGAGPSAEADGTRELSCPEIAEPGALLLLGPHGSRIGLSHDDLISIIQRGKPEGLRCVVLSACHSDDLAYRLVHEAGVEHAIGFCGAIDDDAACKFSTTFYRNLSTRGIVEDAFAEGKLQIELEGRPGREQVKYFFQPGKNRRPLIY